jgi:hypothetical protein
MPKTIATIALLFVLGAVAIPIHRERARSEYIECQNTDCGMLADPSAAKFYSRGSTLRMVVTRDLTPEETKKLANAIATNVDTVWLMRRASLDRIEVLGRDEILEVRKIQEATRVECR